ncbi:hypothetical protein H5410_006095 [Solanum commersonii]|uniref:Uncharacterized protein n=1 Tax=Solanum commersonii TaxID=4109 RepID=A0A9J6A8E1_SOLCO|nr:hypothetical protein H5410_006095 [Solanum commersonii]
MEYVGKTSNVTGEKNMGNAFKVQNSTHFMPKPITEVHSIRLPYHVNNLANAKILPIIKNHQQVFETFALYTNGRQR